MTQAEIDLLKQIIEREEAAKTEEADYPCVIKTKYGSVVFMEDKDRSIKISNKETSMQDEFGYSYYGPWEDDCTPFTGTITYKDGKPVKTGNLLRLETC